MPRPVFQAQDVSRRRLLRGAAFVACGGALVAAGLTAPPAAVAKLTKAAASYQTTPKGDARCSVCIHWRAPWGCAVVVGPVSPIGWCSLFVAAAAHSRAATA
jgi:hypothetical protein